MWAEGVEGPTEPDWPAFVDWLESRLHSAAWEDNRRKLAATGAVERHLAVGVTHSTPGEAFFSLDFQTSELPPMPLRLPEEITHVWIIHAATHGRTLAWFPDKGWVDVDRLLQASP